MLIKYENNDHVSLNSFRKDQRNVIKLLSRKCNSIIKDGKLSRSES